MRLITLVLLLFPVAASSSCASDLPEQRPTDLSITMQRGGGQPPTGWLQFEHLVLTVSGASSYEASVSGGESISLSFQTSDDVLDRLYNDLRDNEFDEIDTDDIGEVFDGGGTSVTLRWGDTTMRVDDVGSSSVAPDWREPWERITESLHLALLELVQPFSEPCDLHFAPSLHNRQVSIYSGGVELISGTILEATENENAVVTVHLLPAELELAVAVARGTQWVQGWIMVDGSGAHAFLISELDDALVFEAAP